MQLAPFGHTAPAAIPAPPTAGLLRTMLGDELRGLGAIDGGRPLAPDLLELRFEAGSDALAARTLLEDAIDGVRLVVRTADGRTITNAAAARAHVSAGAAADLLARVRGVLDIDVRTVPEPSFVVWSTRPDVNAHLDALVRDRVTGLPVVWQTRDA